MIDFEYCSPTRFVFGRGAERKTGALVRSFGGTRVLLHYGGGSVLRNGVYDAVVASLKDAGVGFVALGGVQPNPRSGLVREGIALCRKEKVDFVLAVGGGSVIDSAKAIAFGTLYEGDFADYYFGKDVRNQPPVPAALPIGTVLTIAAAGSEGSANSIINLEPGGLKRGATGDALRPKFSILNPEFTFTLTPYQTACGLTDIFAHAVERYFTPTEDVEITDALCEAVMRTVVTEGPKVMRDPRDYAARANVMWAGTVAHNNICGVGRVQDWASHGIEHELSALYDCAHGAGLAVVMPAWMDYVMETDVGRFARFAERVFDVRMPQADARAVAKEGLRRYRAWLKSLGMPLTFEELGAKEEDIPKLVASLGLKGNALGAFRPLHDNDVAAILRSACRSAKKGFVLTICSLMAAVMPFLGTCAETAAAPTELFNGRDLTNWYTFLRGRGRNVDPNAVFTVTNGVIRVSGREMGCLTTEREYSDYRLRVEYRFLDGPCFCGKATKAPDSGILFHSTGPDGGFHGIWMKAHEYNLIVGASGDYWGVGTKDDETVFVEGEVSERTLGGKHPVYCPGGRTVRLTGNKRICRLDIADDWADRSDVRAAANENPRGEWNVAELVCRGETAEFLFNGKVVNRLKRVNPSRGRIQIQSEGCPVEFRRVTLTPLK